MIVVELLASRHFTGPAERVLRLMDGLTERGHTVHFAHANDPPGTLADHTAGRGFATLPDVKLNRKGLVLPGLVADVARLQKRFGGERVLVHTHTSHDHWTAWAWKRRDPRKVALVRSVHETRQARIRRVERPLFASCDAVVAISEAMRADLIESGALPPEKVRAIPGAVDIEDFRPDLHACDVRRELGASPGDPVAGIVSRIKPGRGHDVLVNAFADVLKTLPRARLAIVGRGEGKAALEDRVREAGLSDAVRFLGYRRDDLANIYVAMTASVLLGEGSDGTCRAAMEAMACGRPVVAARVGSLPETVADGVSGRLVDADDRAAIARALIDYLSNPALAAEHGAAARRRMEESFTTDAMVERHDTLFRSLL